MSKKLTALIPILLLLFVSGFAQSPADNCTYLALGDSYTIGEKVAEQNRWPIQLTDTLRQIGYELNDPTIVAQTGWTTAELLDGMANTELHPPYDLVSLLIGVNNQYRDLDIATFKKELQILLDKAIALSGGSPEKVLVLSIPDYGVTPFGQEKNPAKIEREIRRYNAITKLYADSLNIPYVNITPISKEAATDQSLVAQDDLHPSAKMYRQWVLKVLPVVKKQLSTCK